MSFLASLFPMVAQLRAGLVLAMGVALAAALASQTYRLDRAQTALRIEQAAHEATAALHLDLAVEMARLRTELHATNTNVSRIADSCQARCRDTPIAAPIAGARWPSSSILSTRALLSAARAAVAPALA